MPTMDLTAADPIVSSFANLKDVSTRYQVSIMSNLTRNEVRQLRQWSHEQDFRHDIVGMLPLELVIQILQEVDLRTAFRSRRVSKKWAMVLSSSHIVEAILRPWLSRDDPGLHTAEGRPSQTASSIMAEHIDAFCTGRPFSELTVICNASEDQSSWQNLLVYSNGIVSWYDESSGEIIILPLKSGVSKTWVNQNREKPYAIALSEDLLAASTSFGRVFIYNHRTGDEYRIRLSSGYQRMILLRGGTLAILHGSHVTTWSVGTQKVCELRIDPHNEQQTFANGIYITRNHEDLIYYKTCRESSDGATVSFSRRALDGAVRFEHRQFKMPKEPSDISTPPIAISDNSDFGEMISATEYTELRNSIEFRNVCGYTPRDSRADGVFWKNILYESTIDEVNHQLGKNSYAVRLAVSDLREDRAHDGGALDSITRESVRNLSTMPLQTRFSGPRPVLVPDICFWHPWGRVPDSQLLGDETFLVHALNNRLVVYCFDKSLKMNYNGAESRRLRP